MWNQKHLKIAICCAFLVSVCASVSDEKRLIKYLLESYENAGIIGRPVRNTTEKIVVHYGLSLIQILDLDEKNQILTINVWSKYTWVDQLLRWNPKNFSNVLEVRIPPDKIWTPDIVLYNYADVRLKEQRDVMVTIDHYGQVLWIPPAIYKSTCAIDIQHFPFDHQVCELKFGSWTYDGHKLDIQFYGNKSEISTKDYQVNNAWAITARPGRRNVRYLNSSGPYPDLTFFLFLKRNPEFYAYLLVLPCVLLSSLILVIFWLPPESPAKMVLGMNIFVAFFLLLLLLNNSTPSASTHIPNIGYYYCLNMILITVSTFMSVIVINLYFRSDKRKPMSPWLKKKVDQLATFFKMHQYTLGQDEDENFKVVKKVSSKVSTSDQKPSSAQETSSNPFFSNSLSQSGRMETPFSSSTILRSSSPNFLQNDFPNNIKSAPPTANLFNNQSIPNLANPGYGVNTMSTPNPRKTPPIKSHPRPNRLTSVINSEEQDDEDQSSPCSLTTPWQLMNPPAQTSKPLTMPDTPEEERIGREFRSHLEGDTTSIGSGGKDTPGSYRYNIHAERSPLHLSSKTLEPDLCEIRRAIHKLMTRLSNKDRNNRAARDWRMVALLLDRIFFWGYFFFILLAGFILLWPKPPKKTVETYLHDTEEITVHKAITPQ